MGKAERNDAEIVLRGRYRLHEVVGAGGMAAVYRATDELLGRDVAVKVFRANAVDQADIDRQEGEIKLLASLSHHSLVTVLDAGAHLGDPAGPQLFLVMELLGRENLRDRLARAPLPPRMVAQIGFDLAEGLEYLEHSGVVHRDLKPANILLVEYSEDDTRPRARLTDFGIARLVESSLDPSDGITTGTAAYLSPEQASGGVIGPPSDVYSLGLVLLECLSGRMEFPGDPVPSAMARLVRDPVIPAELSPSWRQLLSAMTARNPDDRPPVRDIIQVLDLIAFSEMGRHRAISEPGMPHDEAERMEEVRSYNVLDTPPDAAFDRVTAMASSGFNVPISLVTIVDEDRIWFKSHHGTDLTEIGREPGLCASAILQDNPWVVEDARQDSRAQDNPLVTGDFGLQFYTGIPLRTRNGHNLGTLCVIDFQPRTVTEQEIATLKDLAAMVVSELELQRDSGLAVTIA